MNQILTGEPITVFGDGEQKRAFTYVGDIIDPIARSAWTPEAQNHVFNIGADRPYTVNELANKVISAMGKSDHPLHYLDEREEVKVAYSDHSAARDVFGSYGQTSLDEGLDRMASWVCDVGARKSHEFDSIEIEKNMPDAW